MTEKKKNHKMTIIYEDKEFLVVDKPAKKLTIATNKEKVRTLYHEASEYVKKQHPQNKIFVVHRLDKDTSGIVVFAKNQKIKILLQNNWNKLVKKREYLAVVEGKVELKKQRLESYLHETKTLEVIVTNNKKDKLAITNYECLKTTKNNSLLKVNIETGRKNQIRAQLAYINHPIVGDKKYHSQTNNFNRLALHAKTLEFIHPVTKKIYTFETKTPAIFQNF